MSKAKKVLAFIAVIILIAAAGVSIALKTTGNKLKELAGTRIENVDLSKSIDGVYTGSYEEFPISATVRVTLENKKIARIELIKHVNGKGYAAEAITEKVIETQSVDLDSISGATYSSKVILKAIQNALKSSVQ